MMEKENPFSEMATGHFHYNMVNRKPSFAFGFFEKTFRNHRTPVKIRYSISFTSVLKQNLQYNS